MLTGVVFTLLLWHVPARAQESLTGPIKEVQPGRAGVGGFPDVLATLLVKDHLVHITKDTIIVFASARKAKVADPKVGQRLSAGPVEKRYETPIPQVYVDVIVIHDGPMSKD